MEKTGLKITEIQGEKELIVGECNGNKVISFNPFYSMNINALKKYIKIKLNEN